MNCGQDVLTVNALNFAPLPRDFEVISFRS
jgi:hypothetical protein